MRALEAAGNRVDLVSRLRSWDGGGDHDRQLRIRARGERRSRELIERFRSLPPRARPGLWFTYHVYHKAPDWLGPPVSDAMGIPYLVAEASSARKQRAGPWRLGHAAAEASIRRADAVVTLNRGDVSGLRSLLDDESRIVRLKPFVAAGDYPSLGAQPPARRRLSARYGIEPRAPWLLAAAMMRPGRKLRCFELLARALDRLRDRPWTLIVAGDGDARGEVEERFEPFSPGRIVFVGLRSSRQLKALYAAADLFVWPAIGEPLGMALLEAQASGLPVVAGRTRGVPDIVEHGVSGLLTPPGDEAEFAAGVDRLLGDSERRRAMGAAARARVEREHDIAGAARTLARICARLVH